MFKKRTFYLFIGLLLCITGVAILLGKGGTLRPLPKRKFVFCPEAGDLFPQREPNLKNVRCTLPATPHLVDRNGGVPPQYKTRTFTYSTNSHRFRGREFPLHKESNTFRIIVLGTGVTFGSGVDDKEVYSVVLERMLNKKSRKERFEVLNLGIRGTCTDEGLSLLKEITNSMTFDLVLFCYGVNDGLPMFHRSLKMYRNSLEELMRFKKKHNLRILFLVEPRSSFYPWVDEYEEYIKIYKEIITDDETNEVIDLPAVLDEVEKRRGLRLVTDGEKQRVVRYRRGKPRMLKEVYYPKKKRAQYVSTEIYDYLDTHRVNQATFIDGCHLNKAGHRLVAREIYQYLKSQNIGK